MTGFEILLIAALKHGADQRAAADEVARDLARQQRCLTQAVYYEARGEPERGQRAVAEVVLNRARQNGVDICTVVYTPYQFTFTIDGSLNRDVSAGPWSEAAAIAALYTNGDIPEGKRSITQGANHYHNDTVEPKWAVSDKVTARIGHHIFYRL